MKVYKISASTEPVPSGPVKWVDIDVMDDTGRPVWAFSDGPAGQRYGSILFNTFAEGVAAFPDHTFIIEP